MKSKRLTSSDNSGLVSSFIWQFTKQQYIYYFLKKSDVSNSLSLCKGIRSPDLCISLCFCRCGHRFSHSGSYSSHMSTKKCWLSKRGSAVDRKASQTSKSLSLPSTATATAHPLQLRLSEGPPKHDASTNESHNGLDIFLIVCFHKYYSFLTSNFCR